MSILEAKRLCACVHVCMLCMYVVRMCGLQQAGPRRPTQPTPLRHSGPLRQDDGVMVEDLGSCLTRKLKVEPCMARWLET